MEELAAQKHSGPAQSHKDDQGVENVAPALGQDPPLEQVPGDEGHKAETPRDVQLVPDSPNTRRWKLLTSMWLKANGVELPVLRMDTKSDDGDKEPMILNTPVAVPMNLGSTIVAAPGRSIPAEPSPQQRVDAGRTRGRAARGGGCLRKGCVRFYGRINAWWHQR